MDVSFELDTDPVYIKWEQPFNGFRRWPHYEDELSMAYGNPDEPDYLDVLAMAADDWRCDQNTPITAVVWWGSYIGYRYAACETQQYAPPVKPDYFLLRIWTDNPDPDPCDPALFSQPDRMLWEYRAYEYDEVLVGYDKHPEDEVGPRETVFRYSVKLPYDVWFEQETADGIYWLSVLAVYEVSDPIYNWGWTNHEHMFNDNAVTGVFNPEGTQEWTWSELFNQVLEDEDLSFILFTDPACLIVGEVVGGNLITQAMRDLWDSLGQPASWCYDCHSEGDFDGNCLIDAGDIQAMVAAWTVYDPDCDTNNDGVIDAGDIQTIVGAWTTGCPAGCVPE
jgi:hypothetical protein